MILKQQNTALLSENDTLAKENAAIAHEISQTRAGAPPPTQRMPAPHVLDPLGPPLLEASVHARLDAAYDPPLDVMEAALYGPPPPPPPEILPLDPLLARKIVPLPPPSLAMPTGELNNLTADNQKMAEDNKRMWDVLVASSVNPVAAAVVHSEHLTEDNARLREQNARMHSQLMQRLMQRHKTQP